MTNGEKLKEIFPNIEFTDMAFTVHAVAEVTSNGVKGHISYDFWKDWWNSEYKEPTAKENLEVDCINRNSIKYYPGQGGYMYASKGEIDKLPSVTSIRPKGHWIVEKGGSYLGKRNACCSNCKDFYTNDWAYMNYCPNCGSDNREVEE